VPYPIASTRLYRPPLPTYAYHSPLLYRLLSTYQASVMTRRLAGLCLWRPI